MKYPNTIEFEITKEDAEKCGPFTSGANCLLATAIERLGYQLPSVSPDIVSVYNDNERISYRIEGSFSSMEPNFYSNYPHGFIGRKFVLTRVNNTL